MSIPTGDIIIIKIIIIIIKIIIVIFEIKNKLKQLVINKNDFYFGVISYGNVIF